MTTEYTAEQYAYEYEHFAQSPDWELANIRTALGYFPWLNTPEQLARLQAVKDIQRARRARRARG